MEIFVTMFNMFKVNIFFNMFKVKLENRYFCKSLYFYKVDRHVTSNGAGGYGPPPLERGQPPGRNFEILAPKLSVELWSFQFPLRLSVYKLGLTNRDWVILTNMGL